MADIVNLDDYRRAKVDHEITPLAGVVATVVSEQLARDGFEMMVQWVDDLRLQPYQRTILRRYGIGVEDR